jgi:hypothetical protein
MSTLLRAFSPSVLLTTGTASYANDGSFKFDWSSLVADDGVNTIKPDDILPSDPGRWIKQSSGGSPSTTALVETLVAGEALEAGEPVRLDALGQAMRADAAWVGTPDEVYGIAQAAVAMGAPVNVTLLGVMAYVGVPALPGIGLPIYLAVGGGWSSSAPALAITNQSITKLGIVKSGSSIMVNIQPIAQS